MKMRVLGIFPDATVQRGHDWEWKDQDGGQGSTGRVLELLTPAAHSARSTVKVEWENGRKNVYRLGYKGKVDLQYTEEAPGLECYPQHLPPFDVSHYSESRLQDQPVTDHVTQGDNVVITVGPGELQQLQKARSGWAVGMAECVGKVGKVQGFAANGDAIVSFGNKKYRLYPGALKKVGSITLGSRVRILDDEEKVKMLQDGHGGYNEQMKAAVGKVGEVIKVDQDGDVVVKFGQRHWVFAPACCIAAPGAQVDLISADVDGSVPFGLGGNKTGADLLGLLAAMAQATGQAAGDGLFFKAVAEKQEALALDLLRKNPSLAKSETQGFSALHLASNRGLLRVSVALVAGGADLNSKDKDGDTPLMSALAGGQAEVAELLIQKGCQVDAKNNDGQTAGHKAALAGLDKIMQALVARGADLNAQDNSGDTPLHDAVSQSKVSVAEVILSWPGIDVHSKNKRGHPPLHYACMRDEPEIVDRIIRRDRSTANEKKGDGFTPLHVCACNDHDSCMRILIEKGGATVNVANDEKQTPLHVAAHEAAKDCVQLLVKHGADVNGRDSMGNTPLHVTLAGLARGMEEMGLLMAILGQLDKVKEETRTQIACFLVQHGADPHATNNLGLAALDACPQGHPKVQDAIKRYVAQMDTRRSQALPAAMSGMSLAQTNGGQEGKCKHCFFKDAQILMVPCGHRPLCKDCCSGISRCPECGQSIKTMFDKDGRKVKECIVM
ncbi:E3 ubiquitin-protein ligase MIB2-like isoform X2 [Littorina saxatilis]